MRKESSDAANLENYTFAASPQVKMEWIHLFNRVRREKQKLVIKDRETIVADNFVDIELEHENTHYKGWVQPSEKLNSSGMPTSFHVVLNNIFFGNLSYNQEKWIADDQRPDDLVQAVGRRIEKHFPI